MRSGKTGRRQQSEAGIALLIAIFVLLLISVVAIAMIISSGTESALAGNYRSSTGVYYAAVAGLEEVRARLRPNSPNNFNTTDPGFLPPAGTPLAMCAPLYVINSDGGAPIVPWDPANPYYDNEYGAEFAGACGGGGVVPNPSPSAVSVWNRNPLSGLAFPGPVYKWIRINAVSEQSLNLDVFPYDGLDTNLIYYGGGPLNLNDQGTGYQVYELTALAVVPNGSQTGTQKLLQYLVAPVPITLPPFLAALTMMGQPGPNVAYSAPTSNASFSIKGIDQDTVGTCAPGPPVHAVGVFTNPDQNNVITGGNGGSGIPAAYRPNYTGSSAAPDVAIISGTFPATFSSPAQLEAVMQTVIQNADVVIPSGPVTYPLPTVNGSALSSATSAMSASNPMTVVINGNLDLTSWHNTGYGLILVRGNLNYDPDASWNGIVMVVGQGTVTGSRAGSGEFDGAFFAANSLNATGNILSPNFGNTTMFYANNMGGNGIRYSSCWVQKAQPTMGYKVLSFHEISQ